MGCLTDVYLGDDLLFAICTHDPDTAELSDADFAPPFRIYEAETGVPVMTGTMAKLDDVATTGFYVKKIACTGANGFAINKVYSIYVTATVDGGRGGLPFVFRVLLRPLTGAGGTERTYTLYEGDLVTPISDADVWITTDVAGNNIIASGKTDAFGVMQPHAFLDPGTYYVWRQKAGWDFTNPDVEELA